MAQVSLRSVSKIYAGEQGREVLAVNDFNLEVADREFVVFVGPSGCGKSTTLRMIAGLEEISRGEIAIGDRRVNDVPPKDRGIAMVFQNYALYPHMSVYDNLAFGLKLRGYPKAEIRSRATDAAQLLGIEDLLTRQPKALSGGQRQRVALGRAIVQQPKVFLFDEPLSNLDAKMRLQMRTEIIRLHQRLQTTMIYVTHDQVEAMTMANRIVVMKDGVIQQVDTPLNVYHRPANLFVAGFLGSPPMNLIAGHLTATPGGVIFTEKDGGAVRCRLDGYPPEETWTEREVVLGIRPEDLSVCAGAEPPGNCDFQAVVEFVEQTGAETSVYLQTHSNQLIARGDARVGNRDIGQRLTFKIGDAKVHLFDPVTTLEIKRQASVL